jgi:hypothetical protein
MVPSGLISSFHARSTLLVPTKRPGSHRAARTTSSCTRLESADGCRSRPPAVRPVRRRWHGAQPVELAVQLVARLGQAHVRVQVAVAHFADDRQQRHFEQDHMQPRAAQAQEQLVVFDAEAHVAQVEAEQPQKAQEVGLEEADAFEEGQLAIIQGELAEQFELVADFAQVGRRSSPLRQRNSHSTSASG